MIKKIILFLLILIVSLSVFYFKKQETYKYKIALLQTASHPALNTIREVILQQLQEKYKKDIVIVCKNGEGLLSNIESIANQLVYDDSFMIYVAIGTPAIQSLARLEKNKPIIFGAVTDHTILGIDTQKNICGRLDQIDYYAVIESLQKLGLDKKIGVLYSVGDLSSEYTIEQLEKSNLQIQRFGCAGESELITNIQSACNSSDILFLPTDNMIASAIKIVIEMAKKYNTPIFMTDTLLFQLGGEFAQGVDYAQQGKDISEMITEILENKKNPEGLEIKKSVPSGLLKR